MGLRILLINHYAGSPRHGMEFRPHYFSREWVKAGNQVTILAASFSHLRSYNPERVWLFLREDLEGVKYTWLKTPSYVGNSLRRVVNMLCFTIWMWLLAPWLAWCMRPQIVIASSTYPLDVGPAWLIARLSGARLVFEVHDIWPLSPVELSGMSPRHPFIRVMQGAESFAYRVCDVCVCMLPKAFDHMRKHGLDQRRFVYVPNGILPEEWCGYGEDIPAELEAALAAHRRRYPFILGYVGTHGLANALDTLLLAAARLKPEPIGIVLVGSGPERANLQRKAAELGVENQVLFLPAVRKTVVPRILARMDALYIGWHRVSLYRFGISANKLFDYMMAERPIIQAIEAGNDPVAEAACGLTIAPEDVNALAKAIVEMRDVDPVERAKMGERGHEFVLRFHSIPRLALDMLAAMQGEGAPSR